MLVPVAILLLAATLGAAALMPAVLSGRGQRSEVGELTSDPPTSERLARDSAFLKTARPGGFVASGGDVAKAPVPVVDGWAEQMFTAGLVKDFGKVPHGTRLFHRFAVTNVHAVPVEITGLRASCGCIQATRAKRILQPGESSTIDVSMDTREFAGTDTETIRVAVGPNPVSTCELSVSAVSRSDVLCVPDRIAFGTVARGQPSVRSTDIEYQAAADWKIEEVTIPKGLPVEATLREIARRPARASYRLTVTLKPDARTGRIRDYVYLRTNRKGDPPLPVMVTANIVAGSLEQGAGRKQP